MEGEGMKLLVIGDDGCDNYQFINEKLQLLTSTATTHIEINIEHRQPKNGMPMLAMNLIMWAYLFEHTSTSWKMDITKDHSATSVLNAYRSLIEGNRAVIAFTNGGNERIEKILAAARQLGKQVRVYSYPKGE